VVIEEGALSFWVKPDALSGGLLGLGSLGTRNSYGIFIATHRDWGSKHIVMELRDSTSHYYQAWSYEIPSGPGEWIFVTVTWDCDSVVRACVNGVCGSDKSINVCDNLTLNETMEVGHTGYYQDASAVYDDMKFFDSFMSKAEIQDLYCGQGTLTPHSQTFAASGGVGDIHVSIPADCDWSAVSKAEWIRITTSELGPGKGTAAFSVDPNPTTNDREGVMVVAGKNFVVSERGERNIDESAENATHYLREVMDQCHGASYYVYADADSACNHFVARGKISSTGNETNVQVMDEAWTTGCQSGITCIRCVFKTENSNWGGWYFMNGVLEGNEVQPKPNWGEYPDAGIDLTGATSVTFWARGEAGGENIDFFALGVSGNSSDKVVNSVTLKSGEWSQYSIDLSNKNLSCVLGAFGWSVDADQNDNGSGSRDIIFYLDNIKYEFDSARAELRSNEPRFLVSYKTIASDQDFDKIQRNTAFTYDNALALLAFLARKDIKRAGLIADALVYATNNDRYYEDGRIRNAYQGGDLSLPPGWNPHGKAKTVRMPGWYGDDPNNPGEKKWFEDEFQVSTHTGNVAWAMLALLAFHEAQGGTKYLEAAIKMGDWVEAECRDHRGAGGYTGGYEGWEPAPVKISYKSTEHNIDLFAAFQRLYQITGNAKWKERADWSNGFVSAMWDQTGKKFWTGTTVDGVTINQDNLPLDPQPWSLLALLNVGKLYSDGLRFAENNCLVGCGFDFNTDRDGIWFEGTAQMGTAYFHISDGAKWRQSLNCIVAYQAESGGFPASDRGGLTTGFELNTGGPWLYFDRIHVGATGWYLFAKARYNPFWGKCMVKGMPWMLLLLDE
jgi:hypothetical protein